MYLIKGNEDYFIQEKTNEIITKESNTTFDEIDLIKFYDFFSFDELSDAINNSSLFSSKKILVIKNPYIFNLKSKYTNEKSISEFIELVKNSIETLNTTLIFNQEINKYDKDFLPSKAFLFIEKNAQIFDVKKIEEKNLFSYVYKMILKLGGSISNPALMLFLSSIPNNLNLIEQEIKKLLLINKNITLKMIEENIFAMSNNIDFALSEAILKWQNNSVIIKKINEQIQYGISINQIIAQISNILINAKSISSLIKMKLSQEDITKIINIHPYRIKLHYEFLNRIGIKKLDQLISELEAIDLSFKNGNIDEKIASDLLAIALIK
ncbi:DNA polymerase III subunit delta [Metamycoplasma auris]|uniref:DNA polymerase III subunit delta n=1 Tax=Metamycoplasma auris TaxID=51363 RepID=A0A2W7I1T1_9BACT|nr:DNA polymerase III subunit delta [Metamycoplasma auris]PZW01396.1 DNA polymerase III delta subunit [Metamycoplasma auris]